VDENDHKKEINEKIEERYKKKKTISPQPLIAKAVVTKRNPKKKMGEGIRQDHLCENYEAGGDAGEKIKKSEEKTITAEHSIEFTKEWSAGVSLGVSFYVDIDAHFDISNSKTTTEKSTLQTKITRDRELELIAGSRYLISEDVYEVNYQEEVELEINLSGYVPVYFKHKIKLSGEEHKLHFISIILILKELKEKNELPQNLQCVCEQDHVKLFFTVTHTFKSYFSNMKSEKITDNVRIKQKIERLPKEKTLDKDGKKIMSVDALNNAIFHKNVTTAPINQGLLKMKLNVLDEKKQELVQKAVDKSAEYSFETNIGNSAIFESDVKLDEINNIGVNIEEIATTIDTDQRALTGTVSPATLVSKQGINSSKLGTNDIKLITKAEKLFKEINDQAEMYGDNFCISEFCEQIKEITESHKKSRIPFSEEETKKIEESIQEIQKECSEIDNKNLISTKLN
jgi:hypothetical protein